MSANIQLPSEETQAIVSELLKTAADSLELVKEAQAKIVALEAELVDKNTKLAMHDTIVLEKVASAKQAAEFHFNEKDVRATVTKLASVGIIKAGAVTKIAADLMADPTNALATLSAIADLSVATSPQGFGMARKTASIHMPTDSNQEDAEYAAELEAERAMRTEGA